MTPPRKGIFTEMPPALPNQGQYTLAPPPPVPFCPPRFTALDSFEVHVGVMRDPDATVATATFSADGYSPSIIRKTGSAKRTSADEHDPETAVALAVGRALVRIGRELERRANSRVKEADNNRRQRLASKAKEAGLPQRLMELLQENASADVHVTMIPLAPGAEMPEGFRARMAEMFPNVEFTQAPYPFDVTLGGAIGEVVDNFLDHPETGVKRQRPKHKKDKEAAE